MGALLTYPDNTVQHAGIILGTRGTADHVMRGFPADSDGYYGSLRHAREVSAVTGACMMIRKSVFNRVGGFNEHYATHYQDVDLCCELLKHGYRNIVVPQARLLHHESASRKTYYDWVDRFLLLDRHHDLIGKGDKYYNRHLNIEKGDYSFEGRCEEKNTLRVIQ